MIDGKRVTKFRDEVPIHPALHCPCGSVFDAPRPTNQAHSARCPACGSLHQFNPSGYPIEF